MMDARRLAILEAMGVEMLALRARTRASEPESAQAPVDVAPDRLRVESAASESVTVDTSRRPRLCIVCAHTVRGDARLARLFAQIVRALALTPAAIDWLESDAAGALPVPPVAPAYLVLGPALAPVLGAQLSTSQQNAAAIGVSSDAANLPGAAAGKRALWQVLKPIARRLAAERA